LFGWGRSANVSGLIDTTALLKPTFLALLHGSEIGVLFARGSKASQKPILWTS